LIRDENDSVFEINLNIAGDSKSKPFFAVFVIIYKEGGTKVVKKIIHLKIL